jgi:hypothetical protein
MLSMEENRNVPLSVSLAASIRVSFVDTARNFFRPIHNIKVLLGYEHEPSFLDRIRAEEDKIIERRKTRLRSAGLQFD